MFKVAVTDFNSGEVGIEERILRPLDCNVVLKQCKTSAELIELTQDADFVITQFARVNAEVINAMQRARIIVRYGIGVDNVDLDAARAKGIPVCNVPDYCLDEVADQTLAFILALTRHVVPVANYIQSGEWGSPIPGGQFRALKEQTVGIVGFGRIGREVCSRLKAFKCKVQVFDPFLTPEDAQKHGLISANLDELLQTSDIVSLHCPSTAQTRKMLNAASFAKMKRGALLVNVARGDLIDGTALVDSLQNGTLSGAALDVFETEPIPKSHPILKCKNVVLSPHLASASLSSGKRLRESVAQHVARAVRGEPLQSVVNK